MKIKVLKIIYILAIIIASIQSWSYFDVQAGFSGLSNFCNFNETFNCATVENSPYSTIFGIPVALMGLLWALLGFFSLQTSSVQMVGKHLFILNLIGLLAAGYYFIIMHLVIKTYCAYCLILDILILGANFISLDFYKNSLNKRILINPLIFSFLSIAFLLMAVKIHQVNNKSTLDSVQQFAQAPELKINNSSELILGNPQGSKEIIQYTDFQCPACKKASEIVKDLIKRDDQIKVIIKNYPLSNLCNPTVPTAMHVWSCVAGALAICAQQEGRFEEFYNLVYTHQEQILQSTDFIKLLKDNKFPVEKMVNCANKQETNGKLADQINEGNVLNLQGTPSFFYKNKKVDMWYSSFVWEQILK